MDPAGTAPGAGSMDVDSSDALQRVLAVFCDYSDTQPRFNAPDGGCSCVDVLEGRPGTQVEIMRSPTAEALAEKLEAFRPTFLYITGPHNGDSVRGMLGPIQFGGKEATAGELLAALEDVPLQAAYIDASAQEKVAELLRTRGVPNVMYWPQDPGALVAAQFAQVFFRWLSYPGSSVLEAYALALYAVQAHCGAKTDGKLAMPSMPDLLTASGADFMLPDNSTVPVPDVNGLDISNGISQAVEGWTDVRLLAPRAELRLLLCGTGAIIDAARLSYLGEALRALLVLEARHCRLLSQEPVTRTPNHLPEGTKATRCTLETTNGAKISVVLAATPSIVDSTPITEHAVRHTLVADALSLQFRLPPVGTPVQLPRIEKGVMGGCPVVDGLVLSSVWAVHVLRQLCQNPKYHCLASLGIAGVGNTTLASPSQSDVERLCAIVTNMLPGTFTIEGGVVVEEGAGRAREGGVHGPGPSSNPWAAPSDPPVQPHRCTRAPITECSREEFINDLIAFLSHRRGRSFDPATFPMAVLNGSQVDLTALYREVVTRGGFRVGNGINWKGQVFVRMKNWTANNRQTGIGSALKKHYSNYLWEYEQAHPHDVTGDRCTICNKGEEEQSDWIQCDRCNGWSHFSCDKRPGLGAFESYSGDGKTYVCPACAPPAAGEEGRDDADGEAEPMDDS